MRSLNLRGSLLSACAALLLLSSASARVWPGPSLTRGNFDETVKHGTWLVKHFSPECPHCRKMAPTWMRLVDELDGSGPDKNWHFAEVDCLDDPDVCDDHDITSYPQIILYHNGNREEEYTHLTKYAPMLSWIKQKTDQYAKSAKSAAANAAAKAKAAAEAARVAKAKEAEAKAAAAKAAAAADAAAAAAAAKAKTTAQADSITKSGSARAPAPAPKIPTTKVTPAEEHPVNEDESEGPRPNLDGKNIELDPETFDAMTQVGPWFIKFYAPWCGHCQQLAPTWLEMAHDLRGKVNVGEVDCTIHIALCEAQGILGFPTLKVYHSGAVADYRGTRTLTALTQFAERASKSPLVPTTLNEIAQLAYENDVVFIYIEEETSTSEKKASKEMRTVERAARSYFQHAHFAHISKDTPAAARRYHTSTLPALLAVKDGKELLYPGSLEDEATIKAWLEKERYAALITLSDHNSKEILKGDRLLVLGLLDPGADNFESRRNILKSTAILHHSSGPDLIAHAEGHHDKNDRTAEPILFAWLDAIKWESYAERAYGVGPAEVPVVVIVEPGEEEYWDVDAEGARIRFTSEAILSTLEDARHGRIPPKSSLGAVASWIKKGAKHVAHATHTAWDNLFLVLLSLGAVAVLIVWYAKRANQGYKAVDSKAD